MKGKSTFAIGRLQGKERNFAGESFRACGSAVLTVGFNKERVRRLHQVQKRMLLKQVVAASRGTVKELMDERDQGESLIKPPAFAGGV